MEGNGALAPEGTYRIQTLASYCYANAGATDEDLDATFEALAASEAWVVVDRPHSRRVLVVASDLSLEEMKEAAGAATGVPEFGVYEMWQAEFGPRSGTSKV